jgi:hypothetical protein
MLDNEDETLEDDKEMYAAIDESQEDDDEFDDDDADNDDDDDEGDEFDDDGADDDGVDAEDSENVEVIDIAEYMLSEDDNRVNEVGADTEDGAPWNRHKWQISGERRLTSNSTPTHSNFQRISI